MRREWFRLLSAFTMLLLYVSVLVAGDVIALTCECSHHKADVHTAFNHVHACDTHHDCASHHCDEEQGAIIADKSCCNHNHSNSIALYTQPRTIDNDHSLRQSMLLAVVTDVLDFAQAEQVDVVGHEYCQYLLPPLSAGHVSGSSLRAPPAFV